MGEPPHCGCTSDSWGGEVGRGCGWAAHSLGSCEQAERVCRHLPLRPSPLPGAVSLRWASQPSLLPQTPALRKPWVSLGPAGTLPGSSAQSKQRALFPPSSPCLPWPHSAAARLPGDVGRPAPALRGRAVSSGSGPQGRVGHLVPFRARATDGMGEARPTCLLAWHCPL